MKNREINSMDWHLIGFEIKICCIYCKIAKIQKYKNTVGLSLGIRLGANLISGHLLLLILAGFGFLGLTASIYLVVTDGLIAIAIITAVSGLELAIAGIQSYVYSILTSSYIKDSVSLH